MVADVCLWVLTVVSLKKSKLQRLQQGAYGYRYKCTNNLNMKLSGRKERGSPQRRFMDVLKEDLQMCFLWAIHVLYLSIVLLSILWGCNLVALYSGHSAELKGWWTVFGPCAPAGGCIIVAAVITVHRMNEKKNIYIYHHVTKYWKQQELLMQTQITVTSTCIIRPCIKDLLKQNYQKKKIKKKKVVIWWFRKWNHNFISTHP